MANFDTVGNTLAAHFVTQMTALESTVQRVFDNGPKLTTAPDPRTGEWVRYSWRPAQDALVSVGGKLHRGVGIVDIQIFTPLGSGQGKSERIGRTLQTIFRDQVLGANVSARVISFANVGEVEGWYQSQFRIQIQADEPI